MTALAALPVRRIVRAVADAAERWADADFPPRVRTLDAIVARTGYSLPAVEYALDRLFESIDASELEATIADELGSLDALDTFVERYGRPMARAVPMGTACIISSRTTIGVAILPAIFALCAKCDVIVKDREDHLVAAFFRTLAEEHDAFAHAARAHGWDSADETYDLSAFGTVVAFGRDETLARIRERCAPEARFVGFGAKASAGYISRETLRDEQSAKMADDAARDIVLYETEGCLSLHALFVERGGAIDPNAFAALLAAAVERAAVEFPVGTRDAGTQAAIGNARALAAFRAASGKGVVFSDEPATHLIVGDLPPRHAPLFLPRSVGVMPVDSPYDAAMYFATHGITLEALAANGTREDIVNMAIDAGAARIARFGDLQSPRASGNHGGRPRIADFIRWITDET